MDDFIYPQIPTDWLFTQFKSCYNQYYSIKNDADPPKHFIVFQLIVLVSGQQLHHAGLVWPLS